jgi:hypothetical protein
MNDFRSFHKVHLEFRELTVCGRQVQEAYPVALLQRLMRLIVLVKESYCCTLLRAFCVEYFQLKHHLKARYDLPPQLVKLILINLMIGAIAFFRVSEHYLSLFIELIQLLLLNDFNSLSGADYSTVALAILIVVDWISLSNNAIYHIHWARVLCYI